MWSVRFAYYNSLVNSFIFHCVLYYAQTANFHESSCCRFLSNESFSHMKAKYQPCWFFGVNWPMTLCCTALYHLIFEVAWPVLLDQSDEKTYHQESFIDKRMCHSVHSLLVACFGIRFVTNWSYSGFRASRHCFLRCNSRLIPSLCIAQVDIYLRFFL